MAGRLEGHRIFITGAAGVIGRAVAAAIVAEGGIAIGADAEAVDGISHVFDVTDEAAWERVAARLRDEHGVIDGIVTAAGILKTAPLHETAYADFKRIMTINVDGTFLACRALWPLLRGSRAPAIVTLSSIAGLIGGRGFGAYNASKGAVTLLTKALAMEGAREDPCIRANSVHPAFVESTMVDGLAARMEDPAAGHARMKEILPLGRYVRPEEVAASIVHLLSPESGMTTGSEAVIDGGLTAGV
ncbi:MAG: SDR family oxidoreductase [Pseudomonadota bacterium]